MGIQQTIVNKAEAMRHHAGLTTGFWVLSIDTATHIYNRTPTRVHKWQTPFEWWNGKKPDVSYLRTFGCKAFVHVHKDNRNKLEPKAKIMTFVGYEPGSKGYHFWNRDERKLYLSRDATFDESVFLHKGPEPKITSDPKPGQMTVDGET